MKACFGEPVTEYKGKIVRDGEAKLFKSKLEERYYIASLFNAHLPYLLNC